MVEQVKDIFNSGYMSVIRLADFLDYGSYLLRKRQVAKWSDPQLEAVEEVTADKSFRLLHKYSLALKEAMESGAITDSLKFNVNCGSDYNGIHGKGIAFSLKPKAPEPGDFGYENELVEDIIEDVSKGEKAPSIFCLDAILYMDSFLPATLKKLEPIFFNDGRRGYKSNIDINKFDHWKESGRLSEKDALALESFGEFLTKLTDRELICLGRHETAKNTKDSIKHLFWRWWSLSERRFNGLERFSVDKLVFNREFVKGFKDIYHCSEEIVFKLVNDKEDYVSALSKLQAQSNKYLEALANFQAPADEIWDSTIRTFAGFGHLIHTFTTFVYLIIAKHPKSEYPVPPYVDSNITYFPNLLDSLLKLKLSDFSFFSEHDFEGLRKEAIKKSANPLMFDYDLFWKGKIAFSEFLKFFKETSGTIRGICQKYLPISNKPTFEREN